MSGTRTNRHSANSIAAPPRCRQRVLVRPGIRRMVLSFARWFPLSDLLTLWNRRWRRVGLPGSGVGLADHHHLPLALGLAADGAPVVLGDGGGLLRVEAAERALGRLRVGRCAAHVLHGEP